MKKEIKKYEEIFTSRNFKLSVIIFSIAAILITIINNIGIDPYIKKFIIPFSILILSYLIILENIKVVKNRKAYLYLIPILLSLLSYLFIKIDTSNMVLNVIFIPILLSIFLLSLVNEKYDLSRRFMVNFFKVFPGRLFSNLNYMQLLKQNKSENKNKKAFNIFLGCLIGIPIAIILLVLLTGADKYFSSFIDSIFGFIKNIINLENLVPNLLILLISFIVLFSVFVNVLKNRNLKTKESILRTVNNSISSTILIIVNCVFILFLISEISKLTINFLHLPVEYTYAEYAREGFFQLLFVTVINIIIILYFVYYTTVIKENKLVKNLLLVLVLFSILLIFNSYYRMFLYIGAYGFTILRLQVVLFLLMELILFFVVIKKIVNGIKHNDAFIFMLIIISTYVLNLYLCSKPFIDFINNIG